MTFGTLVLAIVTGLLLYDFVRSDVKVGPILYALVIFPAATRVHLAP